MRNQPPGIFESHLEGFKIEEAIFLMTMYRLLTDILKKNSCHTIRIVMFQVICLDMLR